jgi:hypothetical protein
MISDYLFLMVLYLTATPSSDVEIDELSDNEVKSSLNCVQFQFIITPPSYCVSPPN